MARIGFFEMLLDDDMSWGERDAINDAHDAAETARSVSDELGGRLDDLGATVAEQKREIARLRAALRVLATILCERGLVESSQLDRQLEAAMAKAVERSKEAFAETIACPRCGEPVPPQQTVMTAQGLMCQRCDALVP
jgi:class 3 adenylate cyclase